MGDTTIKTAVEPYEKSWFGLGATVDFGGSGLKSAIGGSVSAALSFFEMREAGDVDLGLRIGFSAWNMSTLRESESNYPPPRFAVDNDVCLDSWCEDPNPSDTDPNHSSSEASDYRDGLAMRIGLGLPITLGIAGKSDHIMFGLSVIPEFATGLNNGPDGIFALSGAGVLRFENDLAIIAGVGGDLVGLNGMNGEDRLIMMKLGTSYDF